MSEDLDPRVARSRAAVLDAATELLLAEGLPAVTVEAVLARSGVARSTLYRHWTGRGELLVDVFRRLVPPPAPAPPPGPLRERLVAVGLDAARSMQDEATRLMISLLHAADVDEELAAFRDRFHEETHTPLATVLTEARAAGELPAEVPDEDVTGLLIGPLFVRSLMLRRPVDAAWVHAHVDRVLRALDLP